MEWTPTNCHSHTGNVMKDGVDPKQGPEDVELSTWKEGHGEDMTITHTHSHNLGLTVQCFSKMMRANNSSK